MAYVTDSDCREIYMVTDKNSSKFKNLSENPKVSLLIDTRADHDCRDLSDTSALTVSGVFEKMDDRDLIKNARESLLERHPHIMEILKQPDAEILRIRMTSFLMLEGLTKSYFEEL
jgi:uncharacterized pyridoxamine 5'-phosphate oxidase family protein